MSASDQGPGRRSSQLRQVIGFVGVLAVMFSALGYYTLHYRADDPMAEDVAPVEAQAVPSDGDVDVGSAAVVPSADAPAAAEKSVAAGSPAGAGAAAASSAKVDLDTAPPRVWDHERLSDITPVQALPREMCEQVQVLNLRVDHDEWQQRQVRADLVNGWEEPLANAVVVLSFPDRDGRVLLERKVNPLVVSGGVFGDVVRTLNPGAHRDFRALTGVIPAGWNGKVHARIAAMEFEGGPPLASVSPDAGDDWDSLQARAPARVGPAL
ncbi:MAG: hypothetical protein H7831_03575 [Magnetococcus sp. WYHC-3]